MPAKQAPDYTFWLPKKEVAKLLDVSTKSVEKFHALGKLHAVNWRRPSGGPKIMVYDPVTVEALRTARTYQPPAAGVVVTSAPASCENPANPPKNSENREENLLDSESDGRRILQFFRSIIDAPAGQKLLGTSETPEKPKNDKPEVPICERVYLTVREAAVYLGWPERQVRALISTGELPARKVGHTRVRRRDLDAL
jgi:excisionase family DNA binding protein